MDILYLKTVIAVINTQSLSKAGDIMNLSKSSVSRFIKRVEDSIEARLFYRLDDNHLELTDAGKQFYNYAIKAIEIEEEMLMKVNPNHIESKRINIGIETTAMFSELCDYIPLFDKIYPETSFSSKTEPAETILSLLEDKQIDLAIINSNNISSKKFKIIKSKENKLNFYISKQTKDKYGDSFDLDFYIKNKLVTPARRNSLNELFDEYLLNNNIALNCSIQNENPHYIAHLVSEFDYMGLLSDSFVTRTKLDRDFIKVDIPNLDISFKTNIIINKDNRKDIVNKMVSFINETVIDY